MPETNDPPRCSQCGSPALIDNLDADGACPACVEAYEQYLAEQYALERWRQMTDAERDAEIRDAIRRSS